jgi:hypothetical protein
MIVKKHLATLTFAILIAAAPSNSSLAQQRNAEAFDFIAMGDMPYNIPTDYLKVDRLIAEINRSKPAFTLHVGDIKSGSTLCSDEIFQKAFDQLATIEGALVFTPGDNEWTDCHRQNNGSYDPLERLTKIRTMFYPNKNRSLGKNPIAVESQATAMAEQYSLFVENTRFTKNGVMFVMLHVIGSNNNLEARDSKAAMEFYARDKANIAWLDDSFKRAKDGGMKAIVVSMQGNLYDTRGEGNQIPASSGYLQTIRAFERNSRSFDNPVLVIHGDEHRFVIDRMVDTKLKVIPHTTRLQVMGQKDVHGVRITVDPSTAGVFGFTPLIIRENGEY